MFSLSSKAGSVHRHRRFPAAARIFRGNRRGGIQKPVLAVEATVRNDGRNRGMPRAQLEQAFHRYLGIEQTIWLQHGLLEDETGGHADNVVSFVAPGRVLCQAVRDPDDPNHPRLVANRQVLEKARDARGRRLEIVDLDVLPYRSWAGRRIAVRFEYLNSFAAVFIDGHRIGEVRFP